MLRHAASPLLLPTAATAEDVCMFFFATADAGLTAEEAAREKAKAAAGAAVPSGEERGGAGGGHARTHAGRPTVRPAGLLPWMGNVVAQLDSSCASSQNFALPAVRPRASCSLPAGRGESNEAERAAALHQPLLVEFALSLLQGALRKGIINPRGPGAGVRLPSVHLYNASRLPVSSAPCFVTPGLLARLAPLCPAVAAAAAGPRHHRLARLRHCALSDSRCCHAPCAVPVLTATFQAPAPPQPTCSRASGRAAAAAGAGAALAARPLCHHRAPGADAAHAEPAARAVQDGGRRGMRPALAPALGLGRCCAGTLLGSACVLPAVHRCHCRCGSNRQWMQRGRLSVGCASARCAPACPHPVSSFLRLQMLARQ